MARPVDAPDQHRAPCPDCGGTEYHDGFVDDAASGKVRWFAGRYESGVFGYRTKRSGRAQRPVTAFRCAGCARLTLYAFDEPDKEGGVL